MSPPVETRVALVGFGKAGAQIHAPLIDAVQGLALTHVVTSDATRAADARARFPGVRVLDSVEKLLSVREDFDTLVVAAPNAQHASICKAFLRAGVPTVVDKPLARTHREGASLLELAMSSDVPFSVFHNRRWDTDFRTLSSLIANGELGQVVRWESRFERWRPEPKAGWRETSSPEDGGGLLLDLLTHLIDQALVVLGPAATVYAELSQVRPGVAAEDDVMVALRHLSGAHSTMWASMVAGRPGPRFRVLGTQAAYVKEPLDWQEAALSSRSAEALTRRAPPEEGGVLIAGEDRRPNTPADGSWLDFYAGWVRTLRDGAPPPVDPIDALHVLRITDAARDSAREHRVIRLA